MAAVTEELVRQSTMEKPVEFRVVSAISNVSSSLLPAVWGFLGGRVIDSSICMGRNCV